MKIISANLNGIRSAAKKKFFDWMAKQNADFVCVQELKAQQADMTAEFLAPAGFHGHFHYAEKKGYSGTGVYSRLKPSAVTIGFGNEEFDAEGRYVQCDFDKLSVISLYSPSGSSSDERQQAKFRFMDAFMPHLDSLRQSGREIVICGELLTEGQIEGVQTTLLGGRDGARLEGREVAREALSIVDMER